jgi:medium-chain acyl-[acyl-carrier-protein] hydrolase
MQPASEALWFPSRRPRPQARLQLFCFPYAGGSPSAFASWDSHLSGWIEVRPLQLPGRWSRSHELPLTRFDEIVTAVGRLLPEVIDRPYAIFGHSMGALLGFEVVRYFRRHGFVLPGCLLVSGRRAPHLQDDDLPIPDMPQQHFLSHLRKLNGTPQELLENPELMELFGPVIRTDFSVCRSYVYAAEEPLDCPIIGFGGDNDPEVAEGRLAAWQIQTCRWWREHTFVGDHFYLHPSVSPLLRTVESYLRIAL